MSKRYTLNKKKFFRAIFTIILALFLLYLLICYVDIAVSNLSGGSKAEWNLLLHFILTFCKVN